MTVTLTPVVADWSTAAELSLTVAFELARDAGVKVGIGVGVIVGVVVDGVGVGAGVGVGEPFTVIIAVLDVSTVLSASVTFK
jgi:hypothetical protein